MNIKENLLQLKSKIPKSLTLVAVSKTKTNDHIMQAYNAGQRIFGENKIQEMVLKYESLPKDIKWHMIGHVQRNKIKYIAPFVELIHGVDTIKLLNEINKHALKNNRIIKCLIQVNISNEQTKFGVSLDKINELYEYSTNLTNTSIIGLMGMASFTNDKSIIISEFKSLKYQFDNFNKVDSNFNTLSIGMSNDYEIGIDCGSSMIRIGSTIFGERNI
tara:strand:+ start:8651 stop:9301 length:651 start_codon:yes stop_codon:yes gene_type:complete